LKVDYSEESSVKKSLHFEIEPEVVDKEIAERSKHYASRVKLPGFRPGKVPAHVIRQRFRQQVLEDVAEKIVNKVVRDELEGRGLRPVATPRVTELKIDDNQPMTFKAEFEILPLVDLPDYKGLPVKSREATVEEADVDKEIDRLREEAARYDPVEGRPAQEGDHVVLDVQFTKEDGTRGKRDENVLVEVGSKDNHKDLNAALVGLAPGDTKDISLTYGEDHEQESLRGKTVAYNVTLKGVKTKVVPAADDEFAKDPRRVRLPGRAAGQDPRPAPGRGRAQDRPGSEERAAGGPGAAGRLRSAGRPHRAPHDGADGERRPRPRPPGARPHQGRGGLGEVP
jgi:trigger factor